MENMKEEDKLGGGKKTTGVVWLLPGIYHLKGTKHFEARELSKSQTDFFFYIA